MQEKHFEQRNMEEKSTYANVVKKSLQPPIQENVPFLGISQPPNQYFIGQAHQVQQPFLGQVNGTSQALLDIQESQKKMLELFMKLNQKANSMCNVQM